MAGKGGARSGFKRPSGMDAAFEVDAELRLKQLIDEVGCKEVAFPPTLTNVERLYIHKRCQELGLGSKSRGNGDRRFVTVFKKKDTVSLSATGPLLRLQPGTCTVIQDILQLHPLTPDERRLVCDLDVDVKPHRTKELSVLSNFTTGRLSNGIAQIPPKSKADPRIMQQRQALPIWCSRGAILQTIANNQVCLVVGDTGCGKTTQVPQYLLEDFTESHQPIRMVVTQPRRLATLAVAERIASERKETLGDVVGYQIRLESKVSPKTVLTICTNGVLLRTLMSGTSFLSQITHIILDEIHERDQHSDFLLAVLRDLLPQCPTIKLVLMSATVETERFVAYFGGACPIVEIRTPPLEVAQYFLENVLLSMNYQTEKMRDYLRNVYRAGSGTAVEWVDVNPECDAVMERCFKERDEKIMLELIDSFDYRDVDYRHSETRLTPLMLASMLGFEDSVKQLLYLAPDVHAKAPDESTALDFARTFGHESIIIMLENYMKLRCVPIANGNNNNNEKDDVDQYGLTKEQRLVVEAYQASIDEDRVDVDLVYNLLRRIHHVFEMGAVLVFLPGYEEITTIYDMIRDHDDEFGGSCEVYMLHSSMRAADQRQVFQPSPPGVRKIVLATNIAETSITISDVTYVIDSGKVKEKSFDSMTCTSMLKSVWIAKASVTQRKGRAGRCGKGVCFHLFTRQRYDMMQEYQTPEILRMQIHELCLQAKALAPKNAIADLLSKVPNPPSSMVVHGAISLLKQMDALTPNEELTSLGVHLLDLPMDPRLAKSVIYAVVLRCLDPILTICCTFAHKDPFELPTNSADKARCLQIKQTFSARTFSDHMAILKAFQLWQESQANGQCKEFCRRNFISNSTMNMIVACRTQVLGQLRASGFVKPKGQGDMRELNVNSGLWPVVKAALTAGAYPSLLRKDADREHWISKRHAKVRFSPRSVLSEAGNRQLPTQWVIFEELNKGGSTFATALNATLVTPITIALFAGPVRDMHSNNNGDDDEAADIFDEMTRLESDGVLGVSGTFIEKIPFEQSSFAKCGDFDRTNLDILSDAFHQSLRMESEKKLQEQSNGNVIPPSASTAPLAFSQTPSDPLSALAAGSERSVLPAALLPVARSGASSAATATTTAQPRSACIFPTGSDPLDPCLRIDSWIRFDVEPVHMAHSLRLLRLKWHAFFLRRITSPHRPFTQTDESLLRAVVSVLNSEENAHRLPQPEGVGMRPRPLCGDIEPPPTIPRNTPRRRVDYESTPRGYYSSGYAYSPGPRVNPRSLPRSGGVNYQPYNRSGYRQGGGGYGGATMHNSYPESTPDNDNISLNLVVSVDNPHALDMAITSNVVGINSSNDRVIAEALNAGKRVFIFIMVGYHQLSTLAQILSKDHSMKALNKTFYTVKWIYSNAPRRPLPFPVADGKILTQSQANILSDAWDVV